jgi:hypothetical protein
MLPLITSHETITAMEWITTDPRRRQFWLERAAEMKDMGMERAVLSLASLLNEHVAQELRCDEPLAAALVQSTLMRINFFELSVSFLSEVDDSDYFSPASPESGPEEICEPSDELSAY